MTDLQRDPLLSSLRGRAREHDHAEEPREATPDQALVALRRRARQIRPVEPAAPATPAMTLRSWYCYSHSMVPGGLDVTSKATRLTSRTSLVMRVEIRASTSYGTRLQSAVIASSEDTGRKTTG